MGRSHIYERCNLTTNLIECFLQILRDLHRDVSSVGLSRISTFAWIEVGETALSLSRLRMLHLGIVAGVVCGRCGHYGQCLRPPPD